MNIPYGTLCGAMTQDIDERAKINTSRSVAAMTVSYTHLDVYKRQPIANG